MTSILTKCDSNFEPDTCRPELDQVDGSSVADI